MSSPARFAFFEEEITPAKAIVSSDICGWLETKKKEILPQRKKKLVALPLRPNHESSTIAILKNNRAELFQSSDKKQTETLPSTNKSQTVSPLSSDNYGAKHLNKPAVVVSQFTTGDDKRIFIIKHKHLIKPSLEIHSNENQRNSVCKLQTITQRVKIVSKERCISSSKNVSGWKKAIEQAKYCLNPQQREALNFITRKIACISRVSK